MTALAEQPTSGPLASIIKATQRLNPCMEIDVDVLAVTRAAVSSTPADWAAGVLTSTAPDNTGLLRLSPPTGVSLFSQLNAVTVNHFLQDSSNGIEEYALDFFPAPGITQGVSFTLSSLDLYIGGAQDLKGFYRITVGYYDENWTLRLMGDPVDILSGHVSALVGNGGVYTIDFIARGHRYTFPSGMQNTTTGSGYDGTNLRTANVDNKNVSHLLNIPRGLSISIRPSGAHATSAFIGCVANGTAARFDTTTFWRHATARECGPYNPVNQPYSGATTDHNPDNYLVTGAVPGYGAKVVTNGSWGIARRIPTAQRAQNVFYTWEQPYHNLKIVGYPSTGTAVNVLDMGATPTNPVELRLDDIQQNGTSLAYVLKGSNISAAGAWTAIAANTDGSVLTGADLYRWYQLTTTFTPGPTGATKYASPALQAWSMVERIALSTYRYLKDVDSTTVADPVTAQSSIGELKVPVMNGGRQDFRDLAAQLGSAYAPSSLEAHVYARNTRSGTRYFLNLYRLENRDPQFGVEEMTFVSGMDRLTPMIPSPTETFRYPAGSGQVAITNVTNVGAVYTITVAGTPFTIAALVNFRMHSVTGVSANQDFTILSNPTTSQFTVNVASGPIPAIGDTFEIHSDQTTRVAAPYVTQDFAAVYADLLGVKAAVPARYRGRLPATTGRTGSFTIPAGGVKALDILQDVALHCGGFPAWDKGRIEYVDFYGPKDSVMTWGDREIVTLETPVGADRRMPSVKVKYGYQQDTQAFTNEATYDDNDTLLGWGRSNLFDVFELPDDFCKWNDLAEAKFMADTLQKAWKSGVRLWKVKTVLCYPWLAQGAAVTIMTDQYTDRRLSFSADSLTDLGVPIAGRTSSIAVIVGKNLWGNEFVVGVRGLDQITSAAVARTGSVAGNATIPQAPSPYITFDVNGQAIVNSVGSSVTTKQIWVVRTDRAPTAAETRAGTTVNAQSITNTLSGTFVTPGHLVYVGVLAYNANGDESALASIAAQRQGGAWDGPRYTGSATGQTTEEGHRGGSGGIPVPGGPIHALPLYDATGSTPLIDTVSRRFQTALGGPTGIGGDIIERGGNKGDQAIDSGISVVAGAIDFVRTFVNKHLGNIPDDGTSDRRAATLNQKTGGDRGFGAIDSGTSIVAGAIDLTRSFLNKHLGNIPDDGSSDRRAATLNQKTGGDRGFAAVDSGNVAITTAVDLSRAYTGKHLGNIPDDGSSDRRAVTLVQKNAATRADTALDGSSKLQTGVTTAATAADGNVGIESQRTATAKGARAAGAGAGGIVEEELQRAGFGGLPTPSGRVNSLPQYDSSGGVPLIDTVTRKAQAALLGPTGTGMDVVEDGGNRSVAALEIGGVIAQGTTQRNGTNPKNVASGRYTLGTGTHTQSISFPANYQNPPAVNILGGISYQPASLWGTSGAADDNPQTGVAAPNANAQVDEVVAYNVTTSGASLRARLRQASATTARTNAFPGTHVTANGGTSVVTSANAPAANDTYTASFTYAFESTGVPGKACNVSATVSLDYWNGSAWINVASATYTASDPVGGDALTSGSDALVATVSGLISTSQFRLRLGTNAGAGSRTYDVGPGNLTYTTTTGDQYTSKTPAALGINLNVEVIGAS